MYSVFNMYAHWDDTNALLQVKTNFNFKLFDLLKSGGNRLDLLDSKLKFHWNLSMPVLPVLHVFASTNHPTYAECNHL